MRRIVPFALVLMALGGPARAQSLLPEGSLVRTVCVACHLPDASGKVTTIESIRTTPEGWRRIVHRMNRTYKLQLDDEGVEEAVSDLANNLCLTPDEMADLEKYRESLGAIPGSETPTWAPRQEPGAVPDFSTQASSAALPADFPRACLSCHAFDVQSEQRRTPESWARLPGMHLGYWPVLWVEIRDLDWGARAVDMVKGLAARFPWSTEAWNRFRAAAHPVPTPGEYVIVGHVLGGGDYSGRLTQTAVPEKPSLASYTQVIHGLSDDLQETGTTQFYAGYVARSRGSAGNQTLESRAYLQNGAWHCSWHALVDPSLKGTETWYSTSTAQLVGAVPPGLVVKNSHASFRLIVTQGQDRIKPGDIQCDDKQVKVLAVKPAPEGVLVELEVPQAARARVRHFKIAGMGGSAAVGMGGKVEFLKLLPSEAVARVGGGKVNKVGAQFEARGCAVGPDGQRWTADDVDLGVVNATFRVDDYNSTDMEDDPRWVGKLDALGHFTPGSNAPNPDRTRHNNTGDVWIVALYEDLRARVLLRVTFPDYRPDI